MKPKSNQIIEMRDDDDVNSFSITTSVIPPIGDDDGILINDDDDDPMKHCKTANNNIDTTTANIEQLVIEFRVRMTDTAQDGMNSSKVTTSEELSSISDWEDDNDEEEKKENYYVKTDFDETDTQLVEVEDRISGFLQIIDQRLDDVCQKKRRNGKDHPYKNRKITKKNSSDNEVRFMRNMQLSVRDTNCGNRDNVEIVSTYKNVPRRRTVRHGKFSSLKEYIVPSSQRKTNENDEEATTDLSPSWVLAKSETSYKKKTSSQNQQHPEEEQKYDDDDLNVDTDSLPTVICSNTAGRCVTFLDTVVTEIRICPNLKPEEKSKFYYTQEEMQKFRIEYFREMDAKYDISFADFIKTVGVWMTDLREYILQVSTPCNCSNTIHSK